MILCRALSSLTLAALLAACEDRAAEPGRAPTPPPAAVTASASPPAVLEAAGVEYLVHYIGGANPRARLPMLVVMHGLGDRPESFEGLVDGIAASARVVLPRGLKPYRGGHSWFDIDIPDPDVDEVARGVEHAADRLAAALSVWAQRYPTHGKPVVSGFSQGGMLSFALAVKHSGAISAAVPVAGWLPRPLWPQRKPDAPAPIVALHGDVDNVLPIAPTREGVAYLQGLGFDVTLLAYAGVAHQISPPMNRELLDRLAASLEANGPK